MGPIYKTQWKTCPGVIPTRACRHLLTNSLYGQEKQKYPHACHSVHVWEMMFQKWKTQRERREGGMRGGMCICPFKSPQARAECWESRPVPFSWPLREGRSVSASTDGDVTSEKMQEGATNTSARPNTHIIAGADTLHPLCLTRPAPALACDIAKQPHTSSAATTAIYCSRHG